MFKIALIVITVSISNPEKPPDISIPVFYKTMKDCHNQMDKLVDNINAIEAFDNNNNRILKLYNRGYNQEGIIYWYCKTKDKKLIK